MAPAGGDQRSQLLGYIDQLLAQPIAPPQAQAPILPNIPAQGGGLSPDQMAGLLGMGLNMTQMQQAQAQAQYEAQTREMDRRISLMQLAAEMSGRKLNNVITDPKTGQVYGVMSDAFGNTEMAPLGQVSPEPRQTHQLSLGAMMVDEQGRVIARNPMPVEKGNSQNPFLQSPDGSIYLKESLLSGDITPLVPAPLRPQRSMLVMGIDQNTGLPTYMTVDSGDPSNVNTLPIQPPSNKMGEQLNDKEKLSAKVQALTTVYPSKEELKQMSKEEQNIWKAAQGITATDITIDTAIGTMSPELRERFYQELQKVEEGMRMRRRGQSGQSGQTGQSGQAGQAQIQAQDPSTTSTLNNIVSNNAAAGVLGIDLTNTDPNYWLQLDQKYNQ